MPVAILQRMPEMFSTEAYDAVSGKAGLEEDPPAGLHFHTIGKAEDGAIIIFDVWDSEEKFDEYREGRLDPALKELIGEEMFNAIPPAERNVYEVHNLVDPPS